MYVYLEILSENNLLGLVRDFSFCITEGSEDCLNPNPIPQPLHPPPTPGYHYWVYMYILYEKVVVVGGGGVSR